jgi:hypothetical protein
MMNKGRTVMNKEFEEGSIEGIANARWGDYEGDIGVTKVVNDALRDNYIAGFKAGLMLRLTGENDGREL